MNIYDISEKAGVSIATVSRVLNGNSRVSEKTRQRILAIMEETGYQPNIFARGLGLNTMNTVGILCADSSDAVLASAVYHIEQELHKYQYDALLCCTGYDVGVKEKYLGLLLSKRVDALILAGSNFVESDAEKNQYIIDAAKEVPVIILNGYLDAPNVYCALCDDADIMQQVTERFLKKTDRILYLYRSLSYSGRKKAEGMKRAFAAAGQELKPENVVLYNGAIDETKQMLLERYEQGARWDVILTSDDELAVGAYKFSRAAGLKVPEELQIVGYNNSKPSICCEPEISSVDNHLEYSSQNAVSMLMRVLSGEQVPSRITVSGDIIVRGTTVDL
ncbi:MAG: LacI family DNA-binding transcriptional regulator [Lachnospiraceae bacterium]|nr:LacI family DNA-binding transcriptional regulator [Lachnospiraceae bacterium]